MARGKVQKTLVSSWLVETEVDYDLIQHSAPQREVQNRGSGAGLRRSVIHQDDDD